MSEILKIYNGWQDLIYDSSKIRNNIIENFTSIKSNKKIIEIKMKDILSKINNE